jgi:hypothetical protein
VSDGLISSPDLIAIVEVQRQEVAKRGMAKLLIADVVQWSRALRAAGGELSFEEGR